MSWPLGPVLVQWSKREAMPPQWTRELKTRSTELVYAHGGASIRAWRVGVCRLAMSAYCCAALSCDAGWHMSYFMTVGQVINKLASFSHQEYNRVRRRDAAFAFPPYNTFNILFLCVFRLREIFISLGAAYHFTRE